MYKKILFSTDFSNFSYKILKSLKKFKELGAEEIVILYVIKPIEVFFDFDIEASYWMDLKNDAESFIKKQADEIENYGLRVKAVVKTDNTSIGIITTAQEEKCDLILIGAYGKGSDSSILGSVTESVIRESKTPVFIFKEDSDLQNLIFKVLFPTDFSDCSKKAIENIISMIKMGAKEVVLLHVQDTSKLFPHLENKIEEFNEKDSARLEEIKKIFTVEKADVKIILKTGIPSIDIINIANEEKVNLIAIGSHGRGFVEEIFLGSVSHKVAKKSGKNVLILNYK